jgi:hypothetical protein
VAGGVVVELTLTVLTIEEAGEAYCFGVLRRR